jgi:precorrin-8X/cobalt-precorrin-8 methylmutase
MKNYINNPQAIEKRSFEIIGEELGGIRFPEETDSIIRRVIHTTADFEYARLIEFKNDAVKSGLAALSAGKKIYADTMMIQSAVNSRALAMQGVEIVNYVHDEDVRVAAKERGVTRSTVAMEKAVKSGDVGIFAIGNAPTALYRLIEFIKDGAPKPALIIGAPIGFVGAAESKKALDALDDFGIPYIRINGRKGGSPVVGAILNALLYRLGREW